MELIRAGDYEKLSDIAAELVGDAIAAKPDMVLGLATGSTPLGLYRRLVDVHNSGAISLSAIQGVNLDEYVGLGREHALSYRQYMWYNLYGPIGMSPDRVHIPDGLAADLEAECRRYDETIRQLGGIDLQILGIGANGHIGFNEPADRLIKYTHVARLDENTRQMNTRFFDSIDQVPVSALTMGLGDIMSARRILLLAGGRDKADALKKALYGDITTQLPASVLGLHPCVTVIADDDALGDYQ